MAERLTITGLHMGRSWTGNRLERDCLCEKAPCGLAVSDTATDCPEHGVMAMKTIRQTHRAEDCPTTDARAAVAGAGTEEES